MCITRAAAAAAAAAALLEAESELMMNATTMEAGIKHHFSRRPTQTQRIFSDVSPSKQKVSADVATTTTESDV